MQYCIGGQNKKIFLKRLYQQLAKHPKKQAFSGTPRTVAESSVKRTFLKD
jgi:hypothetical protein